MRKEAGLTTKGGLIAERLKVKNIQILLSTYNGAAYLKEQLESFLSLDNYASVKVLIRDDGSTDGTVEMLREYRDKHGFEVVFGENLGLNRSLRELLALADKECEYIAFSDQDDIWLPHKLTRAIEAIEREGKHGAVLYCARSLLVDCELKETGATLVPKKGPSFYNAMVQNVAVGHTQVFTRELLELLLRPFSEDMVITDHWNYLIASTAGKVVYDPEATTLYRQHGSNVIGYGGGFFSTLKRRIKRVLSGKPQENSRQLTSFLDIFSDVMQDEHRRELTRFLAGQKNVFKRICYLIKSRVYRQTAGETLIFRTMYLLGRYKIKKNKTERK